MKFRVVALFLLAPCSASAEDIWATPERLVEPASELALSANYEARLLYGLRQVVLRDFDGAVATLRAAAQAEPGLPAAYCHLGAAQFEKGDLSEARAAFESCARFARLSNLARYMSVAYVGLARAVERSDDTSLSERREAWVRARDGVGDDAARALASARLAAYDAALAREAAYAPVRERCAARRPDSDAAGCL